MVSPCSSGACLQNKGSTGIWAYLNDPMPTQGPQTLLDQMQVVDRMAMASGRSIERYIIESGGEQTSSGMGARLKEAIHLAYGRSVTMLVASGARLASTHRGRKAALADLLGNGIAVEDPTGALHPSTATKALAQAALQSPGARGPSQQNRGFEQGRAKAIVKANELP